MFKVEIETDNAAFDEGYHDFEVARILRALADTLDMYGGRAEYTLRDINGNTVGKATSEETD